MSARRIFLWAGIIAMLYALCLIVFYFASVATVVAIRGSGLMTWATMYAILLEAAVICIPLAVFSALLVAFRTSR